MARPPLSPQTGFTLVELMIAMVLGLIVLLAVSNLFLAQREAFQINQNLALMQDNARFSFELMARELREAGGNPCGVRRVANVVKGASTSDWLDWTKGGVQGFDDDEDLPGVDFGTAATERVEGTDAVIIRSSTLNDGVVITDHNPPSAQFKVNTKNHGIADGDILMVCDYRQAAIFQVTQASPNNVTIVHNTGGSVSPGNCSKGLGFPTDCSSTNGNPYSFEKNGFLSRLGASAWYVGYNDRGGRSLFRMVNGGDPEEIADGISDLQLQYLTRTGATPATDYVDAADITSWANDASTQVIAVRAQVTVASTDAVGSDGNALARQMIHVVSLRHRESVQ